MNRERRCLGGNSYQKDLVFNPIEFLHDRLKKQGTPVSWLDLCCGEGRALIEAASIFADENYYSQAVKHHLTQNLQIMGIDLAGMFQEFSPELTHLKLIEGAIEDYAPEIQFDLITCVHGLHYIGDKLDVIKRAASWLKADGSFLTNLDLNNVKLVGKQNSKKIFSGFLIKKGFKFESRKHLLSCTGRKQLEFPFEYAGADDQASANYTGQPAVDSYYLSKK
jgi:SAM-dependent methyltransferase